METRHTGLNHEEIAQRAYHIWETSGRPAGSELKNWLQAENELVTARSGNARTRQEKPAPSTTAQAAQPEPGKHEPVATTASKRSPRPQLTPG